MWQIIFLPKLTAMFLLIFLSFWTSFSKGDNWEIFNLSFQKYSAKLTGILRVSLGFNSKRILEHQSQVNFFSKIFQTSKTPCLFLPCLGAGHDQFEILGKLRNTRLDSFCQKLKELTSSLSSSFEYQLYLYLVYNFYSKLEFCKSNTLNFWQKQSNPVFLDLPKISDWSCPAQRYGRTKHSSDCYSNL